MLWSASAVTSVSSDTEPTIVIHFESGKYIFNAGENTGRAWLQSRSRWGKAKALFLTQTGTQRGSGVPGLMMFLADAGIKNLDAIGPQGLLHYLATMRTYLWRDGIQVKPFEARRSLSASELSAPTPLYKDANIDVYAIPLFASPPPPTSTGVALNESEPAVGVKRKRSPSPGSASSSKRLNESTTDLPTSQDTPIPPPPTLNSLMMSQEFSPSALSLSLAEEWRKLTVENMFPATTSGTVGPPPSASTGKKGKQEKKTQGNGQPDAGTSASTNPPPRPFQSGAHQKVLLHRDRQLPKFTFGASQQSLCYVVVGPAVRGKFDAKKADALGVPKGPTRGKLVAGNAVTFQIDDGNSGKVEKTVHPEELMGPSDPPHVVMILDVPSVDHIPALVSAFDESPFYSRLRSKKETDKKDYVVHALFHLCGLDVLEHETYKAFMNGFSDTTHHIVSSRQHSPNTVTFTSAATNQLALNELDEEMFPVHKFQLDAVRDIYSVASLPSNVTLLRSGLSVGVRPAREPIVDQVSLDYDRFHPIVSGSKPLTIPEKTQKAFEDAKTAAANIESTGSNSWDDIVVVPLGTSSASPSKYRNVSSTLIQIPNHGNILLDCGEGTWGQLARAFGDDDPSPTTGVWQVLRDLKCIFLSHIHGDHHIGLAKVLAMRKKLNPPPQENLYVVGIRPVHLYLRELSDLEDLGVDSQGRGGVVSILSDALNWRNPLVNRYNKYALKDAEEWMKPDTAVVLAKDMCASLGLENFKTVDVDHRTRCYGVVIDHRDKWRIVFSGDTMPTQNLVKAGLNATLLIHEATMGDDQEELAKQKAHSTFAQAIDIGTDMWARNIMLTHFSARYPKMPPSITANGNTKATVVLAFDHARVRIGDMQKLRAYLPALEQFYSDVAAEDNDNEDPPTLLDVHVPDNV